MKISCQSSHHPSCVVCCWVLDQLATTDVKGIRLTTIMLWIEIFYLGNWSEDLRAGARKQVQVTHVGRLRLLDRSSLRFSIRSWGRGSKCCPNMIWSMQLSLLLIFFIYPLVFLPIISWKLPILWDFWTDQNWQFYMIFEI